jgi:predicted nucleic acid-binding protein
VFVDTNLLIYSTRPSSSFHRRATAALAVAARLEPRLAIGRQVMREYLAVVTRPGGGSAPIPMAEAVADIERFAAAFDVLEDGPDVGARVWRTSAAASRSRGARCMMQTSSRPSRPMARPGC